MLTGEPVPVEKVAGDEVTGGTLNRSGSFVMAVSRTGSKTTLAQIVRMVAEAQRRRASRYGVPVRCRERTPQKGPDRGDAHR